MKRSEVDITKLSPMMRQYIEIKETALDALLFFRLGDFYELFFEDAHTAASILEIAMTGKQCGLNEKVPMCGVPHHAANNYIAKLVEAGYKVAICEQVEEAGATKGIVKRAIVNIVTGGTLMNQEMLSATSNNFVGSLTLDASGYVLSYADMSTGDIFATMITYNENSLISWIKLYDIKEIVINDNFDINLLNKLQKDYNVLITNHVPNNESIYKSVYKHIDEDNYLKSIKLLLSYLNNVAKTDLDHLKPVVIISNHDHLKIDYNTKKNLELTETLRMSTKENSLLAVLDKTKTALGARMLKSWLLSPLTNQKLIEERYDMIDALRNEFIIKDELKEILTNVYDLERLIGRISYGNASAKDLLQLKITLRYIPVINDLIAKLSYPQKLIDVSEIYYLLEKSIDDEATHSMKDTIIKRGFNQELDELKDVKNNSKDFLITFEQEEKVRTGIKNLKIGFNKVFGYYIEVSNSNLSQVKEEWGYERKQTLTGGERFITPILKEKENIILRSEELINALEQQLFIEVKDEVKKVITDIQHNANIIANIDALLSLAEVSLRNGYVRPTLTMKREFEVINGRHPVVEKIIDTEYVGNDIIVKDHHLHIITGPNMSGKSTYLKQIALTTIMAQIGSFVPADVATIPLVDAIYTRIGASDNLVSGESTFMVEMLEAGTALSCATSNSLILFDELGRGTATYDGMSLAYAIIEYISKELNCITYFSTHYHELTALASTLDNVANIHVGAEIVNHDLIFKHKIKPGAADKSYGIYVAKLAKLPYSLIKRAETVLHQFEQGELADLAVIANQPEPDVENNAVINKIQNLNINELSPLAAHQILNELIDEASKI